MKLEISTSELPDISSGTAALTVARAQVADLLHFEEPNENRAFRFQAYRQVTLWAHGKLGRRAAKIQWWLDIVHPTYSVLWVIM